MKVVVLYHPESDHARSVLTFERDFKHRTDKEVELLSLETQEGADMARLYDITRYPAVIAAADNGRMLKIWQDEKLPLIDEVNYYAQGEQDAGTRL